MTKKAYHVANATKGRNSCTFVECRCKNKILGIKAYSLG